MNNQIGIFKKYVKKPNNIKFGYLYTAKVNLNLIAEENRTIRVFLPEGYSANNKYAVLYMLDGQNCFDKYTSLYGEWNIDEHINNLVLHGFPPFICVGVDSPHNDKSRTNEMLKELKIRNIYKLSRFGVNPSYKYLSNEIVQTIKPLVDRTFSTNPDRYHTAIGGSSMGGLMSFCMALDFADIFSFGLVYSPAFFFYDKKTWIKYLEKYLGNKPLPKISMFCGGNDKLELKIKKCTNKMYNLLKTYKEFGNDISLFVDLSKNHNEAGWSSYFEESIKKWLTSLK